MKPMTGWLHRNGGLGIISALGIALVRSFLVSVPFTSMPGYVIEKTAGHDGGG